MILELTDERWRALKQSATFGPKSWRECGRSRRGRQRVPAEPRSPTPRARAKAGLTQTQFANLLGVSERTLQQGTRPSRTKRRAKTHQASELASEVLRQIAA